jgi:hypothetical protein
MFLECGVVLSHFSEATQKMAPEDIAKLASDRAGIQSEKCVAALRRYLRKASVSDFSAESLQPALQEIPFFQLHPGSIQPVISALVGVRIEAAANAAKLTPETITLTSEVIIRMSSEDVAKHAYQRAGIHGMQYYVAWLRDDSVAQLCGRTYKKDWQREHLSQLFADSQSPYFRANPTHREPITMALVSMRVEADSLAVIDAGNSANEDCDVDLCIAAALRALASVSSHTYSSDTVERRHVRQLAAAALAFTVPSSCTAAERLLPVQVEKRFQHQTPFQQQLVVKFQLHLATLSNLAFESFTSVNPHEPLAAPQLQISNAVEDHSVAEQRSFLTLLPLSPHLASIVLGCSQLNMPAEGIIAAAAILAGGPFWKRGAGEPALRTAVAAVIDEIKAKSKYKESAMNSATFGRIIAQFAPNFKEAVKTELKNEPGLVFFGERGSQFVYFDERVSSSSQSVPASSQFRSADASKCDFSSCVAVVASCIRCINPEHSEKYIYSDFVENMSKLHKVERKTLSAILRQVSTLMYHLNSIDVAQCSWAPSSFADMLRQSQSGHCKFPPMEGWSSEGFNRDDFESVVMQQAKSLGSKCFHVSCDGKVKAAVFRTDGTLCDVSTPLTFDERDPPCTSCTCFSLTEKQIGNSMDLIIRSDDVLSNDTIVIPVPAAVIDIMIKHGSLPVQPACFISIRSPQELSIFGPQEALNFALVEVKQLIQSITEKLTRTPCVVPVNGATLSFGYRFSLGLGLLVASVVPPSDTNVLIISDCYQFMGLTSEKQIPFFNLENLETQLFTAVTVRLQSASTVVPLPLDVYFEPTHVAEPRLPWWTSTQVVDAVIAKMGWPENMNQKFRSIPSPPSGERLACYDLEDVLVWMDSDLGDEVQTRRAAAYMAGELRILAFPPAGAGKPGVSSAKKSAPCSIAYVVFGCASDARIAYETLSGECSDIVHLPVESVFATRQSGTAFRVAFALSHFEQSPSDYATEDTPETTLKPIWYCGRQLFPVNMTCCNHSAWHSDRELSSPLLKAVCCTHHVKRLNVAALRAAKMKLGSFHHTGQTSQLDAAGSGSEQPEGARSLKFWTCCNQPSCDSFQMNEVSSVACPSAFREHLKGYPHLQAKQMFSFCWERHYFASESDQLEALKHPSAIQFARSRDDNLRPKIQPPSSVIQRAPGGRAASHEYSLVFVDQRHKQEASQRMSAQRRVPFQFGGHLQVVSHNASL